MKKVLTTAIIFVILINFINFIKPASVLAATLSLSPASGTEAVGSTFTVDIIVDPGTDSISAASAIVDFDSSKLTALTVTKGSLFNQDPLTNTIGTSATDPTKGEIRYDSGSLGTAVTTRGTMATITFRAIAAGSAPVTFVFDPTVTTGTSLVAAASGPTNLLTTVNNAVFTVTAGGTTTTTAPLPPTGAIENTLMMVGGGVFLLIGSLFLKLKFLR
ncbi:cohesin domain-containing protein [Patescibacteria group bacterium]|nr:cohesin domain-containing protein [Patescibacteria group bacterium]